MRTPRAFSVEERSTDWGESPASSHIIQIRSKTKLGKTYVEHIGDVFVVRNFICLSLFNGGLKFCKSKSPRGFSDCRCYRVLCSRALYNGMVA